MDIKILVACDKDSYVLDNSLLFPIQVGSALSKNRYEMLHDDEGNNISRKNRSYCELTALYWAWKNLDADYYGLFHYRRYMCFDESLQNMDSMANVLSDDLSDETLEKLSITENKMKEKIPQYDAIVVRKREVVAVDTIYEEYGAPETQHIEDLDAVIDIIHEKYPEFDEYVDAYLNDKYAYDCNMFIMKKDIFNKYCEWLFSILEEAEDRINTINYGIQEYRVFGYLAERLCGIYFTYLKNKDYKICELPKVLVKNTGKSIIIKPINNSVPVVISSSNEKVPVLSVLLESLQENTKKDCDVLILHDDITLEHQNMIIRWYPSLHIRFIDMSGMKVSFNDTLKKDYRLLIPYLLDGYHKVICLDTDMVLNDDLSKLYEIEMGNHIIGACKDIVSAGIINLEKYHQKEYIQNELGVDDPYQYFQSDVCVLNVDKYKENISKEIIEDYIQKDSYKYGIQDVWNILCKNDVFYLPQCWNVVMNWENVHFNIVRLSYIKMAPRDLYYDYQDGRNVPSIINYDAYQKPWEYVDCDMSDSFWKYARKTPQYELLKTMIQSSLYEEKKQHSLPSNIVYQKGKNQRLLYSLENRGISGTLIHAIKRIIQRITGKYAMRNGERVYID